MASNTKLNSAQKEILRDFKAEMPKNMAFGQSGRVTVLAQITGNVVKFSTAVASPDEKKIRRKVGQYYAAGRWDSDQFAVMPALYDRGWGGWWTAEETANYIAEMLDNRQ
jgi:hypothetical protein